ncbi:ATP synthase F0 subunit B [Mycoplasmopsis gallinarum]|uniref:ATP synthase subunit b n=1 Tax=Mycoplasmopsis gallinarum TaxID=29557 RepID=A0A168REZ3_9BACT|nr:ATP synthase F0 subunit B [Mycoplasmopsis gallinarum]OAB48913.1 ATP synthase F0 sector subunit b [Mycoplasmopsis gallinarum]
MNILSNLEILYNASEAQTSSNSDALSSSLYEKFMKLFPSWPIVVATLIAISLAGVILYFLFYKKLKASIQARKDYIQNNINNSQKLVKDAQTQLDMANQKLISAQTESRAIIKKAKEKAGNILVEYTDKAKSDANRLLEEAKFDISVQQKKLLEESKNEIAKAATALSKKILNDKARISDEETIIKEFLESK